MNPINDIAINLTSSISLDTVAVRITNGWQKNRNQLGTFFAILRVEEIATLVPWAAGFTAFLEEAFYRALDIEPMITVEKALGAARRQGRGKLQQILREGRNLNPQAVHYCFGSLKDNSLWLTHEGSLQGFLLHRLSQSANGAKRYRWLDIFKTPPPRGASAANIALSATIVSGPINSGDILILCTPSIIDTIGLNHLEKILTDKEWDNVETLLARHFRTGGGRWTFGAVIVRPAISKTNEISNRADVINPVRNYRGVLRPPRELSLRDPAPRKAGQDIISNGIGSISRASAPYSTKSETSWSASNFQSPVANFIAYIQRFKKPQSALVTYKQKPTIAWRLGRGARTLASLLIRTILLTVLLPIRFLIALTSQNGPQQIVSHLKLKYDALINFVVEKLKALPRSAQRLLIVAALFAFLFVQSLVFLAERQEREAELIARKTELAKIQEQIDAAESNIIFRNTAQAVALIQNAQELIEALPQKTRDQLLAAEMMRQSLNETRGRLERVVTIDSPILVGKATSAAFDNPQGFLLLNSEAVLYRGANNSFAQMNLKNGETKTSQVSSVNIGRLQIGVKDDDERLVFLADGPELAVLNLASSTLTAESVENADFTPQAFDIYNKRLYLLEADGRQVWRYQKTAGGYGRGSPWLKGDATEVSAASGLVVDGSLYILLKNGVVKKYEGGLESKTSWSAQILLNPPSQAARLQNPLNSDNLYAFDRPSRRLFVWDKTDGHLVIQYALPQMDDLKDFAVDEKNNEIYLLNGNDIFKIFLNQNT